MINLSVIIPVYNEATAIEQCLLSLKAQTKVREMEIIVIDDGSTDDTKKRVEAFSFPSLILLEQSHKGPAAARNLGAQKAQGTILVFVDADMEFAPEFLEKLVAPIEKKKTIGTYSTDEGLLNTNDLWAVCWNQNFAGSSDRVINATKDETPLAKGYHFIKSLLERLERKLSPIDHTNVTALAKSHSHLPFRAILRTSFLSVGGFTTNVGYTDDWTLAEKLETLPTAVSAPYYHKSPSSLTEIWQQARWIGRDQLKGGNIVRKVHSLLLYNPLVAIIRGIWQTVTFKNSRLIVFQMVYSLGITLSVLESFITKKTAK